MKCLTGLLFLIIASFQLTQAQMRFSNENQTYREEIKTVICYNDQKEQSMPVLTLKSAEKLLFSFDDLDAGSKNYWYTIEHYSSDWKPSALSPIEYLESFSEDRLQDYEYASNTLQKYTHYSLSLPNEQISPKLSGNYLLKVYLDGDQNKPVISQRFYVVENRVNVGVQVLPSMQVPLRNRNQKINFSVFHTSPIQNPFRDLKAIVLQNNMSHTATLNQKPSSIRPGEIQYYDPNQNDFSGGNEFRKFDIRSLRSKSANVYDIQSGNTNQVVLFPDAVVTGNYVQILDENGNFYIRNQNDRDIDTESDYAQVQFSLKSTPAIANKAIYIAGRFSNYLLSPAYKLTYHSASNTYQTSLLLKQGLYDYKYLIKDLQTGQVTETLTESSFFETDNSYQIFIYFKSPGSRYEELIGYSQKSR